MKTALYNQTADINIQQQQQQQHFISPQNIPETKDYNYNSTDNDGALAARNNLRVKNARQPVKRKDV